MHNLSKYLEVTTINHQETQIKYNLFSAHLSKFRAIGHPDIRVKHCAYDHSVATLLNPRGVTTVSHKHSLTVARHATVAVAVPSTVHYPANYKIELYYFR
jgi:hypothetical protein